MKITCTRENASEEINGIPFERQADGSVVATGVSPEAAAVFADFPGYVVEDEKELPPLVPSAPQGVVAQAVDQPVVDVPVADTPVVAAADVVPADAVPADATQVAGSKPAKPKK